MKYMIANVQQNMSSMVINIATTKKFFFVKSPVFNSVFSEANKKVLKLMRYVTAFWSKFSLNLSTEV